MAVPSTTLAGGTSGTATSATYYDTIVVENNSGAAVFVRTDGTAASATAAGNELIPSGATAAFPNQLPRPNSNDLTSSNPPLAFGWNTQTAVVTGTGYYPGGFGTNVSVAAASAWGASTVTVSFQ